MRSSLALLWATLLLAAPAAAQETFTLSGRVVSRDDGAPIAAATVELPGVASLLTDADGAFRFTRLRAGRYTLTVDALGYASATHEIALRADTTITIELEVRPVPLDSLEARARFITLRGTVVEAADSTPIFDADVHAGLDHRTSTNAQGGFRIRRVPASRPLLIEARALGFLPAQITMDAAGDTVIRFALAPDPIGRAMIDRQLERLNTRLLTLPVPTFALTRDDILRYPNWTAHEFVQSRATGGIGCLLVDEQPASQGSLQSYMAEEIERIEIVSRGRMVRVYTRRFLQRLVAGGIDLHRLRSPHVEGPCA